MPFDAACRCEPRSAEEAVAKAQGGHYQLACACAFEGLHQGAQPNAGINHPAGGSGAGSPAC